MLDATFADVDDELANRPAPGQANPLGTAYAHVAHAEDAVVNGLLQGREPLCASTHAARTGVDQPMPMPGMSEGDMGEWFRSAKVDVEALMAYAADVFAGTEAFIAGADEATLGRNIDLSFVGLGETSFPDVISMLVVEHCNNFSGEISAIKGVFGARATRSEVHPGRRAGGAGSRCSSRRCQSAARWLARARPVRGARRPPR